MAKCVNCGTELAEGIKFCPNCGKPIEERKEQVETNKVCKYPNGKQNIIQSRKILFC